jgi:hypothetical protein
MPFMPSPEDKQRYRRRVAPVLAIVVGCHYLTAYAFEHYHLSRPVAILVALLSPLSQLLLFTLIWQFLSQDRDEVQIAYRRDAIARATAGTLAVSVLWTGLKEYDLVPDLPLGMAFPIFTVFLLIAGLAIRRRYR